MTTLYAQPYNIEAVGFYFDSYDQYLDRSNNLKDCFGQPVEEFEIQFIEGERLDEALFSALTINQGNISYFFDAIENWGEEEKIKVIIAVGEVGCLFDLTSDNPNDFEMDLYYLDSIEDLAHQFVEEGIMGDIPKHLEHYIDYVAIARDLSFDYADTCIDGKNYVYRCF